MTKNVHDMFYGAPPIIHKQAKELRAKQTRAEKVLWSFLSNKQLKRKFRRQHPINQFIADFYCHELKLVIEVDGEIHENEDRKEYDKMRDEHIRSLGVRLIRFKNARILENPDNVVNEIKKIIVTLNLL